MSASDVGSGPTGVLDRGWAGLRDAVGRLVIRPDDPDEARYQAINLQIWAGSVGGCLIGFVLDIGRGAAAWAWLPFILMVVSGLVLIARHARWRPVLAITTYVVLLAWVGVTMLREPAMVGYVMPGLWAALSTAAIAEPYRRSLWVGAAALVVVLALLWREETYTATSLDGSVVLGTYPMPLLVVSLYAGVQALIMCGVLNSVIWRHALADLNAQARENARLKVEMDEARSVLEARVSQRSADLKARSRELQERTERLRESLEHRTRLARDLTDLSERDDLTGLHNRRHFLAGMQQALVHGGPVTLLVIDIDRFKAINDEYGHPVGDQVLVRVAAALREEAGPHVLLARLGGEEFGLLAPGAALAQGLGVASACCRRVESISWTGPLAGFSVTVSIGAAALDSGERSPWDVLMQRADRAMYRAKEAGRNRVVAADGSSVR